LNSGKATAEGTEQYCQLHPDLSYHFFANTGLRVSEAGFGGYRIDISVPEHRTALQYAMESGINLIDTSANYADGGSERLIGTVLSQLIESGGLSRKQLVIVSKGGYLQGGNLRLSQERKRSGSPFPDLVVLDESLEHCIHPVFLADQISRSLQRMKIDCIDGYLLHNPEYYLKWAKQNHIPQQQAKQEYLRRIRQAFEFLETEVAKGRIGCYGISSNTFPKPESDYEFTSLSAVWELAETISPEHHFRVIEFPCNLFETNAVTLPNQPQEKTLLEFARDKNLATLINRPLNAIVEDQLVRLADNVYQGKAAIQAEAFRRRIADLDPDWKVASLSQLALRSLRSTGGITSVLVGMRQTTYVDDVLRELRQTCPVEDRRLSWSKVAQ